MRPSRFTLAFVLALGLAGLTGLFGQSGLSGLPGMGHHSSAAAQDDTEPTKEEAAAREKVKADALAKAVERGKALFHAKELGRKACASCHEDPDKPQDDLRTVKWSYPAYSRRKKSVVTLQQKINEMIKYKARGKQLDADSTDLAAVAAYVESIRTK